MSSRTLFLAWQDRKTRRWFPVGRLDADVEKPIYRFRYIFGAKRAKEEVEFPPLLEFPDLHRDYQSSELFPLFKNRVIASGRPDRADYLRNIDLPDGADPIEILSVNGGRRVTDSYEVFPKLVKHDNGCFTCRFFLHGWRYANPSSRKRIDRLKENENLYVTLELTNPATRLAVQIQTEDYHMIGWAPHYLMEDLAAAMSESPHYAAHVARLNPQPAPSRQRVLIEMRGTWDTHEPMTGADFELLVR